MPGLSYDKRLHDCKNPLLKKLYKIILDKKTNLCIAANFDSVETAMKFIDKVGQHICMLKIQSLRFDTDLSISHLMKLFHDKKKQYNFLLFEDHKFNDIEDTIKAYYKNYVRYADLVTVTLLYPGVFNAIRSVVEQSGLPEDEPRGCFCVCEASVSNSRLGEPGDLFKLCLDNSDICVGIIAQGFKIPDEHRNSMTKASPGVHIQKTTDNLDQNWRHPQKVIEDGADVLIVGRGIVSCPEEDWERVTIEYKETSWQAYLDQL